MSEPDFCDHGPDSTCDNCDDGTPSHIEAITRAKAEEMRTKCLRVAQDQARQLEEMGEHEKAECIKTVISRIEALP